MARRHYNLPPLTTLAVFEAAARHLSFKDAAQELNVTPGAVSHQIKALEGELDIALFFRRHRGVTLTEGGQQLFTTLAQSFTEVSATLSRLRRAGENATVSVAATTAVSSLWLTPRLARFWKEHGQIPVNQEVSDQPPRYGEPVDLRIRYGRGPDDGRVRTKLFRDRLVPVCSPGFARRVADTSLAALAGGALIHLDAHDARWTTWASWFGELGHKGRIAAGSRVNNYMIALQAAQDDAGIVLGWKRLARPLLEQGRLVTLGPHELRAPHAFYILSDPRGRISPGAVTLRDWLLANI